MGLFSKLFGGKPKPANPAAPTAPAARAGKDEGPPPLAMVVLRTQPRRIEPSEVEQVAHRLFGFVAERGNPKSREFIVSKHATNVISTQGWVIMIHSFPVPYWKNVDSVAERISELRCRDAILKHKGWTSVDIMLAPQGVDRNAAYKRAAVLLAEFLDESCLMLYSPEFNTAIPFNINMLEDVRAALRADEPMSALREVMQIGVQPIAGDDPRLKAAVAEAQRRWPEFVEAWHAKRGEGHSIKAPITVGTNTEFIWIEVKAVVGDTIRGTIGNEPVDLGALRIGDEVDVPAGDVNDWLYIEGKEMRGGFSVTLLMEQGQHQ